MPFSDGIVIIQKRRMLRIRKQANSVKRLSKTSSNHPECPVSPDRVPIIPKDLLFESNSNIVKIHADRGPSTLNKSTLEGNSHQMPKLQRRSRLIGLDPSLFQTITSSQKPQGDGSILVSVKSALIYPKDQIPCKQNKGYRKSLKKTTLFNFCNNASLLQGFSSQTNQSQILPSNDGSFDERDEIAQQKRHLRKNKTKRLTQIVVKNHELAVCQNIHKKFQQNLQEYINFIRKQCHLNSISFYQLPNYPKNFLQFYLDNGFPKKNIRQALRKRWWWNEQIPTQNISQASLIWADGPQDKRFLRNTPTSYRCEVIPQIGSIRAYEEDELAQILSQKSQMKLDNHFYGQEYSISETLKILDESGGIKLNENIRYPLTYNFNNPEEVIRFTQRYFAKGSHGNHSSHPLWLIKNKDLNILRLCSNYKEIKQFLKEHSKKDTCCTVQEFINNPFLFKNKKVDIKAYLLITRLNNITRVHWWREGCIAISIEDYLNFDPLMHMATDSHRISHQKIERPSTKLPFSLFNEHCLQSGFDFLEETLPIMKETARHFISSKLQVFEKVTGPTFEILQLSYILGAPRTPWLINVKPSSNHPIQSVMSCMIDDALKLTVDLVFPPPSEWPLAKRFLMNKGYAHNDFELLLGQPENEVHQSTKPYSNEESIKQIIVESLD